jgi:carboxyl-terminal processing protease
MKYIIFTILLTIGLVVGVGVAIQSEPDALAQADPWSRLRNSGGLSLFDSPYKFERLDLLKRVADKVSNDYVEPTRVVPEKMLDESLNYAARVVPEAMFDYEPGDASVMATVGAEQQEIQVGKLSGIRDLTRVLQEVAAFLGDEVPADTDMPDVEYALINGMLSTLDPHSVFINPEAYAEMAINNEGEFGGLGITIGNRWKEGKYRLTILYPLENTPAYRAGLMTQDRIVKIGNESTVNMTLEEAVSRLRGAPGTPITITIERDVENDVLMFDVTLERELIHVPSVKGHYLGDGIGGIQIVHFSQDTWGELNSQIGKMDAAARAEGLDGLEGLVLDLRDNPGGYLSQAIQVSDKFIDSGVLVSTKGHGRQPGEVSEATRYGTEKDLRLAVLVDSNSASASEIFAGAIRNLDRGVVLGVTTFGKGSVQNLYPFHSDGSALKLTIDQYLTPGEFSIQSIGIPPDIELRPVWVEDDGDAYMYWQDAWTREKDLDDHFVGGQEGDPPRFTCLHLSPRYYLWDDDYTRDEEPDMSNWADDFQIQFARTIVAESSSTDRKRMLAESFPAVQQMIADADAALVAHLEGFEVDWRLDQAQGTPRARVSMEVGSESGLLPVGERTPLTLSVTNEGDAPFLRLRAMAEGDLLDGAEFVFGRIDPGETREWTTWLRPGLRMSSRTGEVTFHFYAEGSRAPGDFVGKLMVEEKTRPRFAFNYQVVDDGSGRSSGNGDGLVQAGEGIDLLVMVQNIGEGPTGDHYDTGAADADAAEGLPDQPGGDELDLPQEEDTDAEVPQDEPSGIVKIGNESGEGVFLTEGTALFSLAAGEVTQVRTHFDVAPSYAGELVELELTIGDDDFWEFFIDDLTLPVHPGTSDSVTELTKNYRTKGAVPVVDGAFADAPRVATADGVLAATGKSGNMVRVALPWGTTGWVPASSLKAGGNASEEPTISPWLSRSPPVVVLSSRIGGTAVDTATIEVHGAVRDDQSLKDLYVFVNGTKVFYRSVLGDQTPDKATVDFELQVDLEEGENTIEIVARDNEDLLGSTVVGVYRTGAPGSAG